MTKNEEQVDESKAMMDELFGGIDLTAVEQGGDEPSPRGGVEDESKTKAKAEPSPAMGGKEEAKAKEESNPDESIQSKADNSQSDTDWEKRFKDTQRSFNDEHQKRLQLERELEQFRQSQKQGDVTEKQEEQVEKILADLKTQFEEDPDAAFGNALKMMVEQNAKTQRQIVEMRKQDEARMSQQIDQQERAAKKRHEDYEQFVDDGFVQELQSSPELIRRWNEEAVNLGGDRAEAAYQVAKRHRAYQEYLRTGVMPDYAMQKTEAPKPEKREIKTLSDVSSAPPPKQKGGTVFDSVSDVAAHVFGGMM